MRSRSSATSRAGGSGGAEGEERNLADGTRGVLAGGGKGELLPKKAGSECRCGDSDMFIGAYSACHCVKSDDEVC